MLIYTNTATDTVLNLSLAPERRSRIARRMKRGGRFFVTFLAWSLTCAWLWAAPEPRPLPQLHAHNDYEHEHPLVDALNHGFCSVEADIHLVDGKLLVAHNRDAVKPERTLEALYLEPLRMRIRKNGGRLYPGGPECVLLIDIKGHWQTTYPVLRAVLEGYADILSTFKDGKKQPGAILAIVTGDRSKEMFSGESTRYAALDGELNDLNGQLPADLIPWISSNWAASFAWRGQGDFPAEEKSKLKQIISQAHAQRRRVRFWGSPDKPVFWKEMLDNGVDLINTDDLAGAEKFVADRAILGL